MLNNLTDGVNQKKPPGDVKLQLLPFPLIFSSRLWFKSFDASLALKMGADSISASVGGAEQQQVSVEVAHFIKTRKSATKGFKLKIF